MKRFLNQPQVTKTHYFFETYSSERRFISYYHQVKNVLNIVSKNNSRKILIVGKGDGVVQSILNTYSALLDLDLTIHTFDFAPDLNPDYLGDLLEIDQIISDNYDIILCCQVLEHIPQNEATQVVIKMGKIARHLVISLPYKALTLRGSLKGPILPEFVFCIKIPVVKSFGEMVDERHYWELGATISVRKYKRQLRELGLSILDAYILKKHGNIYFLILESEK